MMVSFNKKILIGVGVAIGLVVGGGIWFLNQKQHTPESVSSSSGNALEKVLGMPEARLRAVWQMDPSIDLSMVDWRTEDQPCDSVSMCVPGFRCREGKCQVDDDLKQIRQEGGDVSILYDVDWQTEGMTCDLSERRLCGQGFTCQEGVCIPKFQYKEIIDPIEEGDMYLVGRGGPYKEDYILHVDRLVVSEKLLVWVGRKKIPYWFKARREKELRPYEIKVPAGKEIIIRLWNESKVFPPEFRGKIYLTKPKQEE